MFDMFRSRDKAVRMVLGGLLFVVALSMLLYLIPGSGMSASNSGDQVVAEVGGDAITTHQVQQQVQQVLRGRQIPPELLQIYVPQMLDDMIATRAMAYEAQRLGFEVTDADLANTVRSFPNVASMSPTQYRDFVENMGYTVPEFESNVRKQEYLVMMQNVAFAGTIVTPKEAQEEFKRRNEKVKVSYLLFSADKDKAAIKPTPEQLKAYYDQRKNGFSVPETRSFELLVIDPQKVSQSMQVADADARKFYDSHLEQFRTPERVKVRHILLMTNGKSKEEVDKIHAKAEELLKKVKAGGDFAQIAKANSEDPGSKDNGGDLGWVVRGQTVKNFENSAFSLKPNEISGIITTEYGFHILKLEDKQPAHLQSFDEVKAQIAGDLKKNTLNDRVQTIADQARAELAKNPQNGQEIANKLGLAYAKVQNYKPGDPLPILGADKAFNDSLMPLRKGEVSPVLQAGNRLAVVDITDVTPPHPGAFAEVENQVRDKYVQDKATELMNEKLKKAQDLLKSNGGDIQAAAKAVGVELKTPDYFTRSGAIEGLGSAAYFSSAFNKPVGSIIGPVNAGSGTVLAKVVDKQEPDMAKFATERAAIVDQLKAKHAEQRASLMQDAILSRLIREGKVKIHKDVRDRILASYRG